MDNCLKRHEQKLDLRSKQSCKSQKNDFGRTVQKWRFQGTAKEQPNTPECGPGGFDVSAYLEKYGSSAELIIGVNGRPSNDLYFQNYVRKCREALSLSEEDGACFESISFRRPRTASVTPAQLQTTQSHSQITQSHSQLTQSNSQLARSHSQLTRSHSQITQSHSQITQSHSQLTRSHSQITQSHSQITQSHSQLARSHSQLARSHSQLHSHSSQQMSRPPSKIQHQSHTPAVIATDLGPLSRESQHRCASAYDTHGADTSMRVMMSLGLQQGTGWTQANGTTTTTVEFPSSSLFEDDLSSYVGFLMRTLKVPLKSTHLGVWLKAEVVPASLDLTVTNMASLQVRMASPDDKVASPDDKVVLSSQAKTVVFVQQKTERVARDLYAVFVDLNLTCRQCKVVVTDHQSKAIVSTAILQIPVAEFHTITPSGADQSNMTSEDQCPPTDTVDQHNSIQLAWAPPPTSNSPQPVPMKWEGQEGTPVTCTQGSATSGRGVAHGRRTCSVVGQRRDRDTREGKVQGGHLKRKQGVHVSGTYDVEDLLRAKAPGCYHSDEVKGTTRLFSCCDLRKGDVKNQKGMVVMLSWGQVCLMKWSQVLCFVSSGPQTSQINPSPFHSASDLCTHPQTSAHGGSHQSRQGLPLSKLLEMLDKPVGRNQLGVWLRLPQNCSSHHRLASYDIFVTNKTIPGNSTFIFTNQMPDDVTKNVYVLLVQLDHTYILHGHVIEVVVKPHRSSLVMFTASIKLPHITPDPYLPVGGGGEGPNHDEGGDEDRTDLGALIQQFPDLQLL